MNDKEFIDILTRQEDWESFADIERALGMIETEINKRLLKLSKLNRIEVNVHNYYDAVSVPDFSVNYSVRKVEHRLAGLSLSFRIK